LRAVRDCTEWREPHPLFHSGFYQKKYPDVAASNMSPLLHYVEYGAAEGRAPNAMFDSKYYLERNPDVAAAGMNPLLHYCIAGYKENRKPHLMFDGTYYLRRHPDLAKENKNPLLHYLEVGMTERKSPNAWFDAAWYLGYYLDVAGAGMDPLEHYLCSGAAEGRNAGLLFNNNYYLEEHPWLAGEGVNPLAHWITELESGRATERYWNRPTPLRRNLLAARSNGGAAVAALKHKPLISILVPTFNTPVKYLKAAVNSVKAQSYPNWELCICDDRSPDESTVTALRELEAESDAHIRVSYRDANGGISRATNDALAMARGDYIAMLDHDDEILPDALLRMVQSIDEDPEVDVLYSDQAYMSADGEEQEAQRKPDWSPRMMWGVMFVGHLLVVRRELASAIGGFNPQFDNVQDFEFMLRVSEKTSRIRHIPEILYYWRRTHASVSQNSASKRDIPALQARAVNGHLRRMKIEAVADLNDRHAYRLNLSPVKNAAQRPVSIFVRACGDAGALGRCLDSIFSKTRYKQFDVFVVSDQDNSEALARFGNRVKTLAADPMLDRIESADGIPGDFWVSLGAEMEIVSPDWLRQMVFAASLPEANYVCPLVLQDNSRAVEEAGLILGLGGSVGPAMRGWPAESDGTCRVVNVHARGVGGFRFVCDGVAPDGDEARG
jgi:O-antigen biosynthesis protein